MKSKLVKGLPQKRWTSPPEVDPTGLAAGLLHGRDATVALHFQGTVVALAMRPQGDDQNAGCCQLERSRDMSPGMLRRLGNGSGRGDCPPDCKGSRSQQPVIARPQ